jgi:hypothetical protein
MIPRQCLKCKYYYDSSIHDDCPKCVKDEIYKEEPKTMKESFYNPDVIYHDYSKRKINDTRV